VGAVHVDACLPNADEARRDDEEENEVDLTIRIGPQYGIIFAEIKE